MGTYFKEETIFRNRSFCFLEPHSHTGLRYTLLLSQGGKIDRSVTVAIFVTRYDNTLLLLLDVLEQLQLFPAKYKDCTLQQHRLDIEVPYLSSG